MSEQRIAIALSARWHTFPERFRWLAEQGFDLEYTPGPDNLAELPAHVDPLLQRGVRVRYHGFFPGYELGDPVAERAEAALRLHERVLDALQGRGQPVITLHVGLDRTLPLEAGRVVENLGRLVRYGGERGITVCLENLRRGPTSDPGTLLAWAEGSGACITFDAGHAVSSQAATSGECPAEQFLDRVAVRVHEAHLYGREEDRHYPIRQAADIRPLLDRLLRTACRWWTVELDDYTEALQTREILRACLDS